MSEGTLCHQPGGLPAAFSEIGVVTIVRLDQVQLKLTNHTLPWYKPGRDRVDFCQSMISLVNCCYKMGAIVSRGISTGVSAGFTSLSRTKCL